VINFDNAPDVVERIKAFNPDVMINRPPNPRYTNEEERLLSILRAHTAVDPLFMSKWQSGRCSPSDICVVLAGYGVQA
jgi:hypothetical protein